MFYIGVKYVSGVPLPREFELHVFHIGVNVLFVMVSTLLLMFYMVFRCFVCCACCAFVILRTSLSAAGRYIQCPLKGLWGCICFPRVRALDPSKLIILSMFDPFWACGALGNILASTESSYLFGKRPGARDMTILGFHVGAHVTDNVNSYWWFFQNSAARPSAGLIFGLWSLPYR